MGAVGRGRLPLLVSIYSGNRKSPASFQSKALRREESCGSATRWSRDRPHVASVPNSSGSRHSFWLSNSCKAKKNPSRVTAANCFRQVVASIARPYRTLAFFQAWRLALGGHSQERPSCNLAEDRTGHLQCQGATGPQSQHKQTNCILPRQKKKSQINNKNTTCCREMICDEWLFQFNLPFGLNYWKKSSHRLLLSIHPFCCTLQLCEFPCCLSERHVFLSWFWPKVTDVSCYTVILKIKKKGLILHLPCNQLKWGLTVCHSFEFLFLGSVSNCLDISGTGYSLS